MIASALAFGVALNDFTPGRLIQVIQACAVITLVLNAIALWKQEPRRSRAEVEAEASQPEPSFRDALSVYMKGEGAMARLVAIGLGTMAFGMQDVLLEPYGGEVLGMSVGETTMLTAGLASGTLVGFAIASRMLSRGADPFRMAAAGGLAGVAGFIAVVVAAPTASGAIFVAGVVVIGLGAGLFGHGTLTATMNLAPKDQAGLALGAWGAVQATAAGIGVALGAPVRDIASANPALIAAHGNAAGYVPVFLIEIALLLAALAIMIPLLARGGALAGRAGDAARFPTEPLDLKPR
jgi:MFS transporter, BCD family, chlorophyll transporter